MSIPTTHRGYLLPDNEDLSQSKDLINNVFKQIDFEINESLANRIITTPLYEFKHNTMGINAVTACKVTGGYVAIIAEKYLGFSPDGYEWELYYEFPEHIIDEEGPIVARSKYDVYIRAYNKGKDIIHYNGDTHIDLNITPAITYTNAVFEFDVTHDYLFVLVYSMDSTHTGQDIYCCYNNNTQWAEYENPNTAGELYTLITDPKCSNNKCYFLGNDKFLKVEDSFVPGEYGGIEAHPVSAPGSNFYWNSSFPYPRVHVIKKDSIDDFMVIGTNYNATPDPDEFSIECWLFDGTTFTQKTIELPFAEATYITAVAGNDYDDFFIRYGTPNTCSLHRIFNFIPQVVDYHLNSKNYGKLLSGNTDLKFSGVSFPFTAQDLYGKIPQNMIISSEQDLGSLYMALFNPLAEIYDKLASSPVLFAYEMNIGSSEPIVDMWIINASNIWVVGASGMCKHYNGSTWSDITTGSTKNFNGIWAADSSNVFICGDDGTLLYYDGSTWTNVTTGTIEHLYSVHGENDPVLIATAVGANGVIVEYDHTGEYLSIGCTVSYDPRGEDFNCVECWEPYVTAIMVGNNGAGAIKIFPAAVIPPSDDFVSGLTTYELGNNVDASAFVLDKITGSNRYFTGAENGWVGVGTNTPIKLTDVGNKVVGFGLQDIVASMGIKERFIVIVDNGDGTGSSYLYNDGTLTKSTKFNTTPKCTSIFNGVTYIGCSNGDIFIETSISNAVAVEYSTASFADVNTALATLATKINELETLITAYGSRTS